jgi:hypothetical protein
LLPENRWEVKVQGALGTDGETYDVTQKFKKLMVGRVVRLTIREIALSVETMHISIVWCLN